jgi:serine/threonine protein kinase
MIGKTVSHYRIIEKIGEGGMGVVYKAEDTNLNRIVALKFLPRELDAHEPERVRFLQEARAASALNHASICTVHALGEHEGQQFIDMEFVDGVTLRAKIREAGMNIQEAVAYAIQIGEALQEAHAKGVVHRDVKPENIMVNTKDQIKVWTLGWRSSRGR